MVDEVVPDGVGGDQRPVQIARVVEAEGVRGRGRHRIGSAAVEGDAGSAVRLDVCHRPSRSGQTVTNARAHARDAARRPVLITWEAPARSGQSPVRSSRRTGRRNRNAVAAGERLTQSITLVSWYASARELGNASAA